MARLRRTCKYVKDKIDAYTFPHNLYHLYGDQNRIKRNPEFRYQYEYETEWDSIILNRDGQIMKKRPIFKSFINWFAVKHTTELIELPEPIQQIVPKICLGLSGCVYHNDYRWGFKLIEFPVHSVKIKKIVKNFEITAFLSRDGNVFMLDKIDQYHVTDYCGIVFQGSFQVETKKYRTVRAKQIHRKANRIKDVAIHENSICYHLKEKKTKKDLYVRHTSTGDYENIEPEEFVEDKKPKEERREIIPVGHVNFSLLNKPTPKYYLKKIDQYYVKKSNRKNTSIRYKNSGR